MPRILRNGRVRLAVPCTIAISVLISPMVRAQSTTSHPQLDARVRLEANPTSRDVLSLARERALLRHAERTPEEQTEIANRRAASRKLAEERFGRGSDIRRGGPVTDNPVPSAGSATAVVTFTVNSAYDNSDTNPGDGVCDVGTDIGGTDECTLRAAIEEANATAGSEQVTIALDLLSPTRGGYSYGYDATHDVWSIAVGSALPTLMRQNSLIDGTKQLDGSDAGTFPDAHCGGGVYDPSDTTIVKVNIDGSGAGPSADGLTGSGEEIGFWGISVTNFGGNGIVGDSALYMGVFCAFVGVDVFGKTSGPNGGYGVVFDGGTTNIVTTSLVSGNQAGGVLINSESSSVYNSYVGTDRKGMYAIPNNLAGVYVGGIANLVGGIDEANRSTISGNTETGVYLADTSRANIVNFAYVGTSPTGTIPVGNSSTGIVDEGTLNTIGGPTPDAAESIRGHDWRPIQGAVDFDRSVGASLAKAALPTAPKLLVSGNGGGGIVLAGDSSKVVLARVGTDASGNFPMSNDPFGILVISGTGNSIGYKEEGNLVSGNNGPGIVVSPAADQTTIRINRIGTDLASSFAVANQGSGIVNQGEATDIAGNFISGNVGHGIESSGISVLIQSNSIGTDFNGDVAIPNQGDGVYTTGSNAVVGGIDDGNLISGNGGSGVHIGPLAAPPFGTEGLAKVSSLTTTVVLANFIGTDAVAQTAVPNGLDGVLNDGGQYATIGQISYGNRIAYNGRNGVASRGASVTTINANRIYANMLLGIDIGPVGVTTNDVGPPHDLDGHQNYPDITSVTSGGSGSATINFEFHSAPSTSYTLNFFVSESADGSGNGEGKYYLGDGLGITDSNGDLSQGLFFTHPNLVSGNWITMTATNLTTGETSEFSGAEKIAGSSLLLTGRVFLQGAYSGSSMTTALNSGGEIPTLQPYRSSIFDGTQLEYDELVTAEDPVGVDWIVLSLRLLPPALAEVARTVGFLSSDGYIL